MAIGLSRDGMKNASVVGAVAAVFVILAVTIVARRSAPADVNLEALCERLKFNPDSVAAGSTTAGDAGFLLEATDTPDIYVVRGKGATAAHRCVVRVADGLVADTEYRIGQ